MFGGDGSSFQHQTFNRAKNGSYADFIPYTLEEMYTVSVIKCCTTCTINANCFSVVFNSDSTQCILLSKGISLDAPTKPELPSNIQAFTKRKFIEKLFFPLRKVNHCVRKAMPFTYLRHEIQTLN